MLANAEYNTVHCVTIKNPQNRKSVGSFINQYGIFCFVPAHHAEKELRISYLNEFKKTQAQKTACVITLSYVEFQTTV